MINPPAPPKSKPVQFADGIRRLLQGKSFEAGVLTGIALAFLSRLIFGA